MSFGRTSRNFCLWLMVLLLALPSWAFADFSDGSDKHCSQEQLKEMLAPIALYPDSLLAQVLLASCLPTPVVLADRWVRKNSGLKGDALHAALEKMDWDPSVKALVPSHGI